MAELDISEAKNELFNDLKGYTEVVGASVRIIDGQKSIVILLKKLNKRIRSKIPNNFRGNYVTHELVGRLHAH